jgi:hypothetical protein
MNSETPPWSFVVYGFLWIVSRQPGAPLIRILGSKLLDRTIFDLQRHS